MLTDSRPANADADSAAISLPGGVWLGWRVSEAVEGFVTSLPRMSRARHDPHQGFPGCIRGMTLANRRRDTVCES